MRPPQAGDRQGDQPAGPRIPEMAAGIRYLDLHRGLLPALDMRDGAPRRIALLVKNLRPSGGNRVIMQLFDELQSMLGVEMHVFVTPETAFPFSGYGSYLSCKQRYGAAKSVRRPLRAVNPADFDVVVSTSRRTLDYVSDLGHPAHVHLLQALEAWHTENTDAFLTFCRTRHYPQASDCIDLVREIGLRRDTRYLQQIASVRCVQTVSDHLAEIIGLCGVADRIAVREPELPILCSEAKERERDIDVLMLLRGFVYNGDDMTLALARSLAGSSRSLAVVVSAYCPPEQAAALSALPDLRLIRNPPPGDLANLYARSRTVVHPPLCAGGGFMPFEALSFGCSVAASRSGWLCRATGGERLAVIDRHDPALYVEAIERFLSAR